jgi:hypothetical protein
MLGRCTFQTLVVGFLAVLSSAHGNTEETVPDWFHADETRPYAIFDAWKELTTRKAMVCLGENWAVLAGQLQNERGEPIPDSPITIHHHTFIRSYSVTLQTDRRGYFLVYSPYSLQLGPRDPNSNSGRLDGCFVSATPGFLISQLGQAFAHKCKASRQCRTRLVQREVERAFYILTCDDQTGFNQGEFETFTPEYLERKSNPRDAWRDRAREPEGKPRGAIRYYDVRVVDDAGNAMPNALVKYQLSGLNPGFQNRVTDKDGGCRVEEWPPASREKVYRILTLDAPGFGVGPVPFDLRLDMPNVIRLAKPAAVVGRVVDDASVPLCTNVRVVYRRPSTIAFETQCHAEVDGTFRFDRVMPNEEFRVVTAGFDTRWHQRVSVHSDWISLKSGGVSPEVKLQVPLASALRGIVVSEDGTLVPASGIGGDRPDVHLSLDFGLQEDSPGYDTRSYVGTNNGPWGPNDGRFGFHGLDSRPFRIRVGGWEVEPTEPIQLEPGEMRFIRVVLKTKRP